MVEVRGIASRLHTSSFDYWSKSVELVYNGSYFEKEVTPRVDVDVSRMRYNFVVDGQWFFDMKLPHER